MYTFHRLYEGAFVVNRIRELRTARGWRQSDLADMLHLKKNTISRYETESLGLDSKDIILLCSIFGCTSDYLIGLSDAPYAVVSNEDAQLLAAYHALPLEIRRAVDGLMAPYREKTEGKNAG